MDMIIPEGVRYSLFNYYVKDMNANHSKMPSFERFFEECLEICKEMNIDLRVKWSAFYDECDKRKINAKKTACSEPYRGELTKVRQSVSYSEDDFWNVERAVAENPERYRSVGYLKNPWADFMLTLSHYKRPELYILYLQAHPEGQDPLPDELLKYQVRLREIFDINKVFEI